MSNYYKKFKDMNIKEQRDYLSKLNTNDARKLVENYLRNELSKQGKVYSPKDMLNYINRINNVSNPALDIYTSLRDKANYLYDKYVPQENKKNIQNLINNSPVTKAYRNAIPSNIRLAVGNVVMPRPINNTNFSDRDLKNYKTIFENRAKRLNTEQQYDSKLLDMVDAQYRYLMATQGKDSTIKNIDNKLSWISPLTGQKENAKRDLIRFLNLGDPNIRPLDYANQKHYMNYTKPYGVDILRSFVNPMYSLNMTTQTIDNNNIKQSKPINGKVTIEAKDMYDFKPLGVGGDQSGLYTMAHDIMEAYGKPVPINLQLKNVDVSGIYKPMLLDSYNNSNYGKW